MCVIGFHSADFVVTWPLFANTFYGVTGFRLAWQSCQILLIPNYSAVILYECGYLISKKNTFLAFFSIFFLELWWGETWRGHFQTL